MIETGVEVGPAIYLARVFDTDVDSVVKFFIFVLIFVFDPMAVIFVISYNVTLQDREKKSPHAVSKTEIKEKIWPVYNDKKKLETEKVDDTAVDLPDNSLDNIEKPIKIEKGGFSRK